MPGFLSGSLPTISGTEALRQRKMCTPMFSPNPVPKPLTPSALLLASRERQDKKHRKTPSRRIRLAQFRVRRLGVWCLFGVLICKKGQYGALHYVTQIARKAQHTALYAAWYDAVKRLRGFHCAEYNLLFFLATPCCRTHILC